MGPKIAIMLCLTILCGIATLVYAVLRDSDTLLQECVNSGKQRFECVSLLNCSNSVPNNDYTDVSMTTVTVSPSAK